MQDGIGIGICSISIRKSYQKPSILIPCSNRTSYLRDER